MNRYLTNEYLESIYGAEVICDSVAPNGVRLSTFKLHLWRPILAEFNTHRAISRNAASSRALPVEKLIERVLETPAVPVWWGRNQSGMSAREELNDDEKKVAVARWLRARDAAIASVWSLTDFDGKKIEGVNRTYLYDHSHYRSFDNDGARSELHKQIANRLLEPWMVTEIVASATDWANLFAQRCHPDAQPEFRFVAERMRTAMAASTPKPVREDEWHLPFIRVEDREWARHRRTDACLTVAEAASYAQMLPCPDVTRAAADVEPVDSILKKLSVARCARVSYLTHEGVRDPMKDIELHDRLWAQSPPHASPFEHVARALIDGPCSAHRRPVPTCEICAPRIGNFRGWRQYRFDVPGHVTEG